MVQSNTAADPYQIVIVYADIPHQGLSYSSDWQCRAYAFESTLIILERTKYQRAEIYWGENTRENGHDPESDEVMAFVEVDYAIWFRIYIYMISLPFIQNNPKFSGQCIATNPLVISWDFIFSPFFFAT